VGGLLSILLAVGLPPTHDGARCEAWAVRRAGELAEAPQPPAAPLNVQNPGLAALDPAVWTRFKGAIPQSTAENGPRFAAAVEGRAPVASAPELVEAAQHLEPELKTLLLAARGSENRLPPSFQLWFIFDDWQLQPSTLDLQTSVRLGLIRGRASLESGDTSRAVETCIGLLGLLRASAGTSLLGRMVAAAWGTRTRVFCLDSARRATPAHRQELHSAVRALQSGWPNLAHTLGQELVFAQVAFFAKYWSEETRTQLPPGAIHLMQTAGQQQDTGSWLHKVRRTLFSRPAGREQCLLSARAIEVADASPALADPALRAMGETPFFWRLADVDDSPGGTDHWIQLFRRVRRLETDLELLRAGLAVWAWHDTRGAWPASLDDVGQYADRRTGPPWSSKRVERSASRRGQLQPSRPRNWSSRSRR
jgi:hypothetical protein